MNNFTDIIKEIYFQMTSVRDSGQDPYYLLISDEVYTTLREEIIKENADAPPNRDFDFFDNLEVVHMPNIATNYIEVRGVRPRYAV